MAEGLCRQLKGAEFEPSSAGIVQHGLNPLAVKVMLEIGIDITGQRSKSVNEFAKASFDYVVTVCDKANETCPLFPAKTKVLQHSFDDPPQLAA